ncbi:MAG: F0F1 ATP synthase subunit B [Acidimicrobiales bacterium]|nr:F0F1 ATP synthase subunit B [Acidimicrobiales bacterium]
MTVEYRLYLNGPDSVMELAFADPEEGESVEGAEEETVNPILPDWTEVAYAIGFFALLYLLMQFVLVPPIKASMDERKEKIRSAKEAADRVESDMGSAQADYDAAVAGARDEANQIIDAVRSEAEARRVELQAEADTEIAALRASADAEVEAAREGALTELRGDVSRLATSAASTVIGKNIDVGSAQSLIDSILDGGKN